jgi:fumarate hydratase class II
VRAHAQLVDPQSVSLHFPWSSLSFGRKMISMARVRTETDSMGSIEVASDRYWGAQTQRCLQHFDIGTEVMPPEVIRALAIVKKAAANVNQSLGRLDASVAQAIVTAATEVIDGELSDHFPLVVWQTGSGTQSNMNVNEVIANRAIEILGGQKGSKDPVHPNDHVNLGQSSNDCFPTAMAIASVTKIEDRLLVELARLRGSLHAKAEAWSDIVKVGRTHLMDATPLTVGQALSGMVQQLDNGHQVIIASLRHLRELAIGGTAVGTGLHAPTGWAESMTAEINAHTGKTFVSAANKFEAIANHDAIVAAHGAIKSLACSLMKIANDVRWLASGPRCGLGELILPANEPGSSMMPGKVNPTQCEAMTMVCARVIGNDTTIAIAGASGNFELNAYKPVMIYTLLQSARLLADASASFSDYCIADMGIDEKRIDELLHRSLMLVTVLTPIIGYDLASDVAKRAHAENISLREAAIAMEVLTGAEFDAAVKPEEMV